MASIALQHREKIIESISQGQRLTDIAHALGYKDHSAIVHRLKDDPEYLVAREVGAEARLEARESDLEAASSSVTVARADRLLGHARWRCEREFPARWGAKQQMTVEHVLRVEQRLERDLSQLLGRVVEGETVAQEPQITHQEGATDSMGSMSNPSALPDSNTSAKRRSSHLDHLAALVHEDEQHEP